MLKEYGNKNGNVLIVSAIPTKEEIETGRTFCPLMASHYTYVMKKIGYALDQVCAVSISDGNSRQHRNTTVAYFDEHYKSWLDNYDVVITLGVDAAIAVGILEPGGKLGSVTNVVHTLGNTRAVCAPNPWFLLRDPDDLEDVECAFRLAKRVLDEGDNFKEEPDMEIVRLETPEAVTAFFKKAKEQKLTEIAYDFETDDVVKTSAMPVTLAMYNGETTSTGVPIVYSWCGYDLLEPRFTNDTMKKFVDAFRLGFLESSTTYGSGVDFIAWNASFDDWVAERWVGTKLPLSSYDAMEMKWVCDKDGKHGLKMATHRYLGYPNYEAPIEPYVKGVKSRRNKSLGEEDIALLKSKGLEPLRSKSGLPTWNPDLDKGYACYALVPLDILERYNCFDALHTFNLYKHFKKIIESDKRLVSSLKLRRAIGKEFLRSEQHGMLLDTEINRKYSKRLIEIEDACEERIVKFVTDLHPELEDFNPNSTKQVIPLLYGDPIILPYITPINQDGDPLWSLSAYTQFYEDVYGDASQFRNLPKGAKINIDAVQERLMTRAYKYTPKLQSVKHSFKVELKEVYINGKYTPIVFTKSGKPSCGVATLQALNINQDDDFIKLLLMYRKACKLRSTFVDGMHKVRDGGDVVHPRYNQVGTASGRGSSSQPNGQNLVKYLRGQFKAREGNLLFEFDLSQAEIRALAAESGDPELLSALQDTTTDVHTAMARKIFPGQEITSELRRYSKTVVFGIIYGIGAGKLARTLGCTKQRAEELIQEFKAAFAVATAWLDKQVTELRNGTHDYYVWTAFGTRRLVRSVLSIDQGMQMHADRIAMNSPIQGDAGEYTFYLIVEGHNRLRELGYDEFSLFNTTHDSVSEDAPADQDYIHYTEEESDGKTTYTLTGGILLDVFTKLVEEPAPVSPLDRAPFKADFELNKHWSGYPNLEKALDPRGELFNWELILDTGDDE